MTKFIGTIALMAGNAIFRGYVMSMMWSWFIIPTFELPELSIVSAIGIALLIAFLTKEVDVNEVQKEDLGKRISKGIVMGLAKSSAVLSFGYIIHLFM